MDKPFKERREHSRIYRHFVMSYREKGHVITDHNVSQVNNVSKGGLNFSTTHPLKQGAVLLIDLKTPFIADPTRLEGLVLECKEKVPELIYEIRVQFQKIPDQVLVALEKIENYRDLKKD